MKRVLALSVAVIALSVFTSRAFAMIGRQPSISAKMTPGESEIQKIKDIL